jgi:hypothetical protein
VRQRTDEHGLHGYDPRVHALRVHQPEPRRRTIMGFGKGVMFAAAAGALLVVLTGCPQKEGPLERAGKSVDKSMDKAGQKIEQTGRDIKDAVKSDKK